MNIEKVAVVPPAEWVRTLSREATAILAHAAERSAGGLYCGDSADMQNLVARGFMKSAGRKSFVPDEYFRITKEGQEENQNEQTG